MRVWSAFGRFSCPGFVHLGVSAARSDPLLSVFAPFSYHGLVRFWAFQLSRSGPLLGVSALTVWSAVGRSSCHGLVHFWAFQLSRSGPLLGV